MLGLAHRPFAHSLIRGSTSEHHREKAGRTQPEHDRTQDIKTGNRHTSLTQSHPPREATHTATTHTCMATTLR